MIMGIWFVPKCQQSDIPHSPINVREYRRGNSKWTIKKNWQHMVHMIQKTKKRHNTIYAEHNYTQTNTNNVSKT
jgi:hypothetical protein